MPRASLGPKGTEHAPHHPNHITTNPAIMGGKPCVRGTRVTVGTIVGLVSTGYDADRILAAYPYLQREDIAQALAYAAWRAEEREVDLVTG